MLILSYLFQDLIPGARPQVAAIHEENCPNTGSYGVQPKLRVTQNQRLQVHALTVSTGHSASQTTLYVMVHGMCASASTCLVCVNPMMTASA